MAEQRTNRLPGATALLHDPAAGLSRGRCLLREHDSGTIKVAQEKLNQLRAPNVELLVTNDKHGGKPHQLNLGLKVAKGDIITIFDAEDEPHPDILQVINTIFLN